MFPAFRDIVSSIIPILQMRILSLWKAKWVSWKHVVTVRVKVGSSGLLDPGGYNFNPYVITIEFWCVETLASFRKKLYLDINNAQIWACLVHGHIPVKLQRIRGYPRDFDRKQKTGCKVSWVILGIWTPVQLFWDSVVGWGEQGQGEVIIAKTISWGFDFRKCWGIKNTSCVGAVVEAWLMFSNCVYRSQRIRGTQGIFIQDCVCGRFTMTFLVGWAARSNFEKSDI